MTARAAEADATTAITALPEGVTAQPYRKAGSGLHLKNGGLTWYDLNAFQAQVAFDGDDVYMFNVLENTNCWIKGTLSGNTVTVSLPQRSLQSGYYNCDLVAVTIDYETDRVEEDSSVSCYTYTLEDGVLVMEEDMIIGQVYVEDREFAGYADFTQAYEPFDPVNLAPEGELTYETWVQVTDGKPQEVEVAYDDTVFYIRRLFKYSPMYGSWLRGVIENGCVVFDQGQYLNTDYGCYVFLMPGMPNPVTGYMELAPNAPMSYTYNPEEKSLVPVDPELYMLANGATNSINLAAYAKPDIIYMPVFEPAVPQNPVLTQFGNYPWWGMMSFDLPLNDIEGGILDINSYYYNIFVDGELYALTPEDYPELEAPITDIPYGFQHDFLANGSIMVADEEHYFSFVMPDLKSMGVRGVYTVNGVTNMTDLVVYDLETGDVITGVKPLSSGSEAVAEEWYDLQGRRVANPSEGVYIRRIHRADGSVSVAKTVRGN